MHDKPVCLTPVLSKVLVKFAGIVLMTDESRMDVTTPAGDEEVSEQPCEVQESSEENTKSQTMTAEEAAAEKNGRLKLIRQVSAWYFKEHCSMVAYISTWYSFSKIIDLKHKNINVIKPVMKKTNSWRICWSNKMWF